MRSDIAQLKRAKLQAEKALSWTVQVPLGEEASEALREFIAIAAKELQRED